MTDWEEQELARLMARYGTVPPPWAVIPDVHPYQDSWRSGYGAALIQLWQDWWHRQHWWQAEQFQYLLRFPPPAAWLEWVIFALWPDAQEGYADMTESARHEHLGPYFQRLKALNFGTYEEWCRAVGRGIL